MFGVFTDVQSAQQAVNLAVAAAAQGQVNLISQSHEIIYIPPMRGVCVRKLSPPAEDTLYSVGGGKFALPGTYIETLAQQARLDVLATKRTDDGQTDCVCAFQVTVKVPSLDGGYTTAIGDKTVDLREGSPGAKDAKGGIETARKFITELCATKARLRAYREALRLTGGGPKASLLKPWVVVSLVPHADLSRVSQSVIDAAAMQALGLDSLLYGKPAQPAAQPAPGAGDTGYSPHVNDKLPPDLSADDPEDAAPSSVPLSAGPGVSREALAELYRLSQTVGLDNFKAWGAVFLGHEVDSKTMTEREALALISALESGAAAEAFLQSKGKKPGEKLPF